MGAALTTRVLTTDFFLQTVQMLTHNKTKRLIDTIESYFINCASHKHFNDIFVNKINYFVSKNGIIQNNMSTYYP